MRVLIAGAGYVGTALASQLRARGHEVFALRRRPEPIEGVTTLARDLLGPLDGLPEVDAVVYLAGAGGRTKDAYHDAYVAGLRNVVECLRPGRLLFTTSTAVYAQEDGELVDETSETRPTSETARCLLEGERIARGEGGTVVRFAGIYGPGRTRLVSNVQNGIEDTGPNVFTNRLHRDDCAGLLAHLLEHPARPETVCGVDDDTAPMSEVRAHLRTLLGLPEREETIPGPVRGKRVSNALARSLGFVPRYPSYRDGYPDIVRAYLAQTRP